MSRYANVEFIATVAVGVIGIAVMRIGEVAAEGYQCDGEPTCVRDAIAEIGYAEWWEFWLPEEGKPTEPGIYAVQGKAWFSEDDAEFTEACYVEEVTI